MTVIELIKALAQCDFNAEVKYYDTLWANEGWGSHADEVRWNEIDDILEIDEEVFIR